MGTAIDYKKQMVDTVYINLPGPVEPIPGMTGGELLHGFLAELNRMDDPEVRAIISRMSDTWNVRYVNSRG